MSETLRQSMTYGTMPTFEEFEAAFDAECPRGTYSIRLGASDSRTVDGFRLGDGEWRAKELYEACCEIAAFDAEDNNGEYRGSWEQKDAALDLVASIMDTLGFEWV